MLPPVVGKLIGDNADYLRSLNQAENATEGSTKRSSGHFSKLGGVIGTAMKVGAAAGVGAIGAFTLKAITGASDLAETLSKVGVVFGDQAGQVTGFANQMAKDFGLPKTAMMDAAASIGLIGKASGMSQGDAAGMSTQLAKMAADASSFYNVPLPEALAAIQSGLVGEAEPMRRFGVLLNEQSVSAEAARMGLTQVNGEYSEGAKAQARASLIMAGMKDASGDLERTQGSLANRFREVQGRVMNFAADVGTRAIPLVLSLMDGAERLAPVIGGVLAGAFDVAKTAVGVASDVFGVLVGVLQNPVFQIVAGIIAVTLIPSLVAMALAAAGAGAQVVFWWVAMHTQAIASTVSTVAQMAIQGAKWIWMGITALASAAQVAAAWLIALGPIALVVAAVIGAAILIVKNWDWIKETVGNVVSAIGGFLSRLIGSVAGAVGSVGSWIASAIGTFLGFRDQISGVVSAVIGFFGRLASAVGEKVGEVASWVAGLPGRILSAIGNLGSLLYNAGRAVISGLLNGIKDAVAGVFSFVGGIAGKIARLKGPIEKDRRLLVPAGRAIMDSLVVGLRDHEGRLVNQLAHVTGLITGVGGNVSVNGSATGGGMAGGSAVAVAGGGGGRAMHVTVQIVTPTGDIPDSTIRKLRAQLFELENDLPPGSIVP